MLCVLTLVLINMATMYNYFLKRKRPSQPPSPPPPTPSTMNKNDSANSPDSVSEMSVTIDELPASSDVTSQSDEVLDLSDSDRASTTPSASNSACSSNTALFFDNAEKPCQPSLALYPKRSIGGTNRSFNKNWFAAYKWLEYNQDMDACFCFPCRVFLANSSEKTFTQTGFRDWKNAKSTGNKKGLSRHEESKNHQNAMALWADKERRERENKTIRHTVSQITSEQQKWLYAVFHVTRFLAGNGLAFRGESERSIEEGDGLYLRTFSQLLFPLEPMWSDIHKRLPQNAKYTSPEIQNEVISVLATLVKRTIAKDICEAKLYTIMADGTTDKNRHEIQGLVCRFLSSDGDIREHCLNIEGLTDRSARGVFEFITSTLKTFHVSPDGIVSQSYDGASVMSGAYEGLQALISTFCDRYILYVHCFLHKISLVVVQVMENIEEICDYFGIVSSLYNFFKKSAVLEVYEGSALKRLIETRWSGHFESTNHVNKNFGDLIQALKIVSKSRSRSVKSEDRALAIGLLHQLEGDEDNRMFVFVNCMLMEVLKPINIIVKQLQSSSENIVSALSVVNAVRDYLKEKCEELNEEECEKMVADFQKSVNVTEVSNVQRRRTSIPKHFDDFIITEQIPSESRSRSKLEVFKESLQLIEAEFDRRFAPSNTTLWEAMEALSPRSSHFLNYKTLIPLYEYASTIPVLNKMFVELGVSLKDLKAECRIFSRVLKETKWPENEDGTVDLVVVTKLMAKEHGKSAPILSNLYKVAVTAGFTSTRVECLFSSLTRVDSPQRRSMKTARECDLAYLAFENKVLMEDITFDSFLAEWKLKVRKFSYI